MPGPIRIQLLLVPDCPLADRVRQTVARALAQIGIQADLEECVGDYASPTLLIEGTDVTGRATDPTATCRLDLPTEQQIVRALLHHLP